MLTDIAAAPTTVIVAAPQVALYDVWSHRTDREPQQINARQVTLAEARHIIALLNSDPWRIRPEEFEIVAAGERAATMPELLARLHELERYAEDLEARLQEATS